MRLAPILTLALAACSGDLSIVEAENDPPAIALSADATSYIDGETVVLEAVISDDSTPWDELVVSFDVTDAVATAPVETEGGGLWAWEFPADNTDATISVTATDTQDASTTEPLTLDVLDNSAPTLAFDLPLASARYAEGSAVLVEITVSDLEDAEQDLTLSWSGLADLTAAPTAPDASGFATFTANGLANGSYTLSATVTDSAGAEVTRSRTFELVDPDFDGDGDDAEEFGGTDCNDNEAAMNGSADEICDGLDNDCNGLDDDDATNATVWYDDIDQDDFGDPATAESACSNPGGMIAVGGDCDDNNNAMYPGNAEICDGLDNDCANGRDDGLTTTLWYLDNDGDDWGAGTAVNACVAPPNHVDLPGDCDDANINVNPDATESCNGINDDCNNGVDEGLPSRTWYFDFDGDTYGDPDNSQVTCDLFLADHVDRAGDCNDNDTNVHPNQTDDCDEVDTDCDTRTDEDNPPTTWYADTDRDNYGDPNSSQDSCTQPNRYVIDNTDCNDGNIDIHPSQTDDCDGVDTDCDVTVDEDSPPPTWYHDFDDDTFGDPDDAEVACTAPVDHVANSDDCDDATNTVHPNITETCNGIDDNCVDGVDEGFTLTNYFYDFDRDGYGVGSAVPACVAPGPDWTDQAGDCNDNDEFVNPSEADPCDGINNDCDSDIDEDNPPTEWFLDFDRDTFGDATVSEFACTAPTNHVANSTDCDDDDITRYPNADEECDGDDEDCDAFVDEGLPTSTWYFDEDRDGVGGSTSVDLCAAPAFHVDNTGDCNDLEWEETPGRTEVCGDGYDNDCIGGDEACGPDYTGFWQVREVADDTTVDFACHGGLLNWEFGRMRIDNSSNPLITLWSRDDTDSELMSVNGCEPSQCTQNPPGMQGAFDTGTTDFTANSTVAPQLGVGYYEHYALVDSAGNAATFASFTTDDHFEGALRITFSEGDGQFCGLLGPCTIPADCTTTIIPIYADRE